MKLIWNSEPDSNANYLLPIGDHVAEVEKAEERKSQYERKGNPDGTCLVLQMTVQSGGKTIRLFDWIDCNMISRITDVLASAGRPVPSNGMENFEESQLVGQTVHIKVKHVVNKKGETVPVIDRYLAPKAVIAGKKAAPSRAKVDHSDIPF